MDPEGHSLSASGKNEHDQAHEGGVFRPFRAIRVVVVVVVAVVLVVVTRVVVVIEVSLVSADAEC